jgi:hypothetical protein
MTQTINNDKVEKKLQYFLARLKDFNDTYILPSEACFENRVFDLETFDPDKELAILQEAIDKAVAPDVLDGHRRKIVVRFFSPQPGKGSVVVGTELTREDAEKLLKEARTVAQDVLSAINRATTVDSLAGVNKVPSSFRDPQIDRLASRSEKEQFLTAQEELAFRVSTVEFLTRQLQQLQELLESHPALEDDFNRLVEVRREEVAKLVDLWSEM